MSTISAGTTTTTAFKVTSDTTGSLLLKTGASGATAIDIDAAQVVSIGNIAVTGGTINNTIIGGTTAAAGSFTTLTAASTVTFNGGTANGVAYLNGSKNLTTGSALTFDGTNFATTGNSRASGQFLAGSTGAATPDFSFIADNTLGIFRAPNVLGFSIAGSEQMRLNATGLGIGTSSPGAKLDVSGGIRSNTWTSNTVGINANPLTGTSTSAQNLRFQTTGADFYIGTEGSTGGGFFPGSTAYAAALYNASATPIQFWTSGALRATLTSAGNFGLGTTNPTNTAGFSRQLQIEGTTAALTLSGTTGTGKYTLGVPGTNACGLWDNTTSAYRWFVDSSGNLLVGTTSAGNARFVVRGPGTTSATASLEGATSGGATRFLVSDDGLCRWYGTSNAETMRLTSAGDLQLGGTLGTTPALGRGMYVESTTGIVGYSLYVNNGVNNRRGSMFLDNTSGVWGWDVTASSGIPYYVWRVAGSEKMRLTDDGRLALAEGNAPTQVLSLYRGGSTNAIMSAGNSNTGLDGTWFGVDTAGNGIVNIRGAFPLIFSTSALERARIHAGGGMTVGSTQDDGVLTSVQTSATTVQFSLRDNTNTRRAIFLGNGNYGYQWSQTIYSNGGKAFIFANVSNTEVGSIVINSGGVAYNTTSDYRLKDSPQPLTGSGAFIDAIQPKTWTWKNTGEKGVGMIAHELAEVSPSSVSGEKDGMRLDRVQDESGKYVEKEVSAYQGVEYGSSELIANLIAEVQSLRQRVASLESK